jgi:aspartate ammonia-lyase
VWKGCSERHLIVVYSISMSHTASPSKVRREHDLLGEEDLPADAYYGIQTQRALENFKISGVTLRFFPELIEALAEVKKAAALANFDLGMLDAKIKDAIIDACDEISVGKLHDQFLVDMVQGGAGTSTNMNANEVIANRALELMGHRKGEYEHCHPNNHVNLSQSTNDAYPTALKIALIKSKGRLADELLKLVHAFRRKADAFQHIIKMGRTQLQDAVPMTLGQTFEAYAVTLEEEIERLENNTNLFLSVNMGGTAIGTGINTTPEYAKLVVAHLRNVSGFGIVRAKNLIEATQDTGAFIMFSSAVKRLAIKLSKICNDLRLLSSGPRTGINEINLPAMQPGSTIMPGKVNPVIPEVVNQIAFKVIGNDLTVNLAVEAGQLELNAFEPIMAHCMFESINMLTNGMRTLRVKCIDGITANEKRCKDMVRHSISIVTALNPMLGYEVCSELSKEALKTDKSIYDLVLEKQLLTQAQLEEALLPENMIHPQLKTRR